MNEKGALRSRSELRNFLRAARGRIDPLEAGIPRSVRRRARPGLRIEELCAIAGLSITWYSALESGRAVSVSRRLLESISDALRLNDDERHYLLALTQYGEPAPAAPDTSVRETLARVVRAIEFGSSMLIDDRWNVLACNRIAQYVYSLDMGPERRDNIIVRMFLDSAYRVLHVDWEPVAKALVAILKMNYAYTRDRAAFEGFVERISQGSPEFAAWWSQPIVGELRPKIMRLQHAVLGPLCLESIGLDQSERWRAHADDTLLVQVPVSGTGTVEALQRASFALP
ncbi:MAG: helix-turn-helix domain-containing protein [Candidatus Eremiobacteraeota bacterium]|nr:helix-turn-helix domain-containing protein [Candidatus Eremiobacteraeota bacterium]